MKPDNIITEIRTLDWSQQFLFVLGMMKLILVAAFFASFAVIEQANAETVSAESCNGKNLLEALERDDPAKHAAVMQEAAKIENADSIFWRVEKPNQPTSWLYGTMHMADPVIATIPDDVKKAILASDTVVIESVEALDQKSTAKAMAGLAHLTLLREGTLRDLVDDDFEDELEVAVTDRGIPMTLADRMQPWLIATTVALPVCEMKRKRLGEKVLDSALAEFAQENNKNVEGLESVAEQLTAIASLPVEYHVSALEETLSAGSLALDVIETMKGLYREGQIGAVLPLMKAVMPKSSMGEGMANFQEVLIDKRNKTMAERAMPLLENGSAFVAVGALHLPGETGLVNLLREAGYIVTSARTNTLN